MASAIRLVDPGSWAPTLICSGAFGRAVSGQLATHFPATRILERGQLRGGSLAGAAVIVLALWRPSPQLSEEVDVIAHKERIPWLEIVMDTQAIRVGPWVTPGAGACHRCYRQRQSQHDTQWPTSTALRNAYLERAEAGPRGFLPHHVRLASGVAARLIRLESQPTGRVVSTPLRGIGLSEETVVGCHGCDRCDRPAARRALRDLLPVPQVVTTGAL
jgi:bacteriocin biosynthesis cyclodehydratase domain-containing protein